ncbi:MAG: hypothetical protein KGL46_06605 [Hyphomicrobiales bacterium]|nr:hypothetical protein [Hyphomicrobiales bacterium]
MAIDGTWNLSINTPMGAQASTVTLKADGGQLSGQQEGAGGGQAIENGSVNGQNVSWTVDIVNPMPMTLEFNGTVSGNEIAGSVKLGAFGDSTFSGQRA